MLQKPGAAVRPAVDPAAECFHLLLEVRPAASKEALPLRVDSGSFCRIPSWHTDILQSKPVSRVRKREWSASFTCCLFHLISSVQLLALSQVLSGVFSSSCLQMSQFIVQCLNPYRKPDCKVGRITTTEDFKHLARKVFSNCVPSKRASFVMESGFFLPDAQARDPGTGRGGLGMGVTLLECSESRKNFQS